MTTAPLPQPAKDAPPVAWALFYADQGLFVGPRQPVNADGICTCWRGPNCPKTGKHPHLTLCPNGFSNYTTDPDTIRAWWTQYPNAPVGLDTRRSKVVVVGPDSLRWRDTFREWGIPDGTPIAYSGGGAGHEHMIFRVTDDCPLTNINLPDDYDVIANGHVALPSGCVDRRGWLTPQLNLNGGLPTAPPWVGEMLRERAARKARTPAGERDDSEDESPVRLDDEGMAWYRGERVKYRKDDPDKIERSGTLVNIGRALRNGNATRRTIISTLRERDHALGYHKYCCGRSDSSTDAQYGAIVDLLEEGDDWGPTPIVEDTPSPNQQDGAQPDGAPCADRVARLEAVIAVQRQKIAELRRENDELRERFTGIKDVIGAPDLDASAKLVGLVTASEAWNREDQAAPPGPAPGFDPPKRRVYLSVIAEKVGMSTDTASKKLTLLSADDGPFIKRVTTDPDNPVEIPDRRRPGHTRLIPRPVIEIYPRHETMGATLRALAEYTPAERKQHGGARQTRICPHCGASMRQHQAWACEECPLVVVDGEAVRGAKPEPNEKQGAAREPHHAGDDTNPPQWEVPLRPHLAAHDAVPCSGGCGKARIGPSPYCCWMCAGAPGVSA